MPSKLTKFETVLVLLNKSISTTNRIVTEKCGSEITTLLESGNAPDNVAIEKDLRELILARRTDRERVQNILIQCSKQDSDKECFPLVQKEILALYMSEEKFRKDLEIACSNIDKNVIQVTRNDNTRIGSSVYDIIRTFSMSGVLVLAAATMAILSVHAASLQPISWILLIGTTGIVMLLQKAATFVGYIMLLSIVRLLKLILGTPISIARRLSNMGVLTKQTSIYAAIGATAVYTIYYVCDLTLQNSHIQYKTGDLNNSTNMDVLNIIDVGVKEVIESTALRVINTAGVEAQTIEYTYDTKLFDPNPNSVSLMRNNPLNVFVNILRLQSSIDKALQKQLTSIYAEYLRHITMPSGNVVQALVFVGNLLNNSTELLKINQEELVIMITAASTLDSLQLALTPGRIADIPEAIAAAVGRTMMDIDSLEQNMITAIYNKMDAAVTLSSEDRDLLTGNSREFSLSLLQSITNIISERGLQPIQIYIRGLRNVPLTYTETAYRFIRDKASWKSDQDLQNELHASIAYNTYVRTLHGEEPPLPIED